MRKTVLLFSILLSPVALAPSISALPASKASQSTLASPSRTPLLAGWNYQLSAFDAEDLATSWTWSAPLEAILSKPSEAFEARVSFGARDAKNGWLLRVAGQGQSATLRFWRVVNGSVEAFGEPEATVPMLNGKLSGRLTLQRASGRVRALWNGRVVVTAWGNVPVGRFGLAARRAKWGEGRLNPTAAAVFSDDFMRASSPDEKESSGEWKRVTGIWKTSGLLGPRADSAKNPNPFVFRAQNSGQSTLTAARPSVAIAGKWFWSDYTVMASVRPTLKNPNEPLIAGLAAFVQEDGSGVVGEVDFRTGRAVIRRGNQVLVTSAPFEAAPNQWHRLFFEPGPGTLRLLVDGVERARVHTANLAARLGRDFAQGPLALTSQTRDQNYVDFDDVRVAPNDAISDDFRSAAVGRWDDVVGTWQTRIESKSGVGRRVKVSSGAAITLTGNAEREEGLVEATFAAVGKAGIGKATGQSTLAVGVVFAARDAKNYYVARRRAGHLEIVEVAQGVGKILGRAKVLSVSAVPAISVQWREGLITARSAGATATAIVSEVPAGRVGAWSDAPAAGLALSSFRALGAAPGWGEAPLPAQIVKDRLMKYWASNASAWKRDGNTWWHSGDFFRDAAISLPLPSAAIGTTVSLLLAADSAQRNSGSRLEMVRTTGGWNTTLWEGARRVKGATVSAVPGQSIRFVRRPLEAGRALLRVAAGAQPILNETVSTLSEAATKVGVRVEVPGKPGAGEGSLVFSVRIVSQERNKLPFIGVMLSPIVDEIQREFRLPDQNGVLIQDVEANAPAAGAGLQGGDVIRAIDGQAVKSVEDVVELVKGKGIGQSLEFKIWRQKPDAAGIDWEQAVATTSNLLDYTFTSAPVDWKATQGRWEVAERWTCNPEWAFFVGSNSVNPTLWSRFRTRGDYTLEAYLATPMDHTRGERSPTDINVTVNGDGRNVASGYSFLFGANIRQYNRIYRGDEIALEKPFELPEGAGNTHQDWFYVRLERRTTAQGVRFRYSVNGKEIANYIDPQPLYNQMSDPGRIAFWTYNGGLSIARVRLWYHDLDTARDTAPRAPQSTLMAKNATKATDLKNVLGQWDTRRDDIMHPSATLQFVADKGEPKRGVLEITNPQSGGDWTVYATRDAFDVAQHPIVRFDYRLPADVSVNLYAKIDGKWREVIFSGDAARMATGRGRGRRAVATVYFERNGARAKMPPIIPGLAAGIASDADPTITIGRIQDVVADGAWHTASFNFLEALHAANPDGGWGMRIQALAFAAPDRDYLRCGIGGNHLGATYWIRNFDAPLGKAAPQSVAAAR